MNSKNILENAKHLTPDARDLLNTSVDARILYVRQDKWIPYVQANDILTTLKDLYSGPEVTRAPGLLLVGRSGNGKTTILQRFINHEIGADFAADMSATPAVYMQMPIDPNESRFWSELLLALGGPHRATDPAHVKMTQATALLRHRRCRMLIVDEIHNILVGHARSQRTALVTMKYLSNALSIPIVLAGTDDAIQAMNTDRQVRRRFSVVGLPRWTLDHSFLRLLVSYEQSLPFIEPSHLAAKELAPLLFDKSGGTIGGLTDTLRFAAIQALRAGSPKIERSHIEKFIPDSAEETRRILSSL